MHAHDVNTPEKALVYLIDCTLATVCDMASKKSRSSSEYVRQKAIAQRGLTWMQTMHIDFKNTRSEDVVQAGGVEKWAKQFEPVIKKNPSI